MLIIPESVCKELVLKGRLGYHLIVMNQFGQFGPQTNQAYRGEQPSGITGLAMKLSGGLLKSKRQAELALGSIGVLMLIVSAILLARSYSDSSVSDEQRYYHPDPNDTSREYPELGN